MLALGTAIFVSLWKWLPFPHLFYALSAQCEAEGALFVEDIEGMKKFFF